MNNGKCIICNGQLTTGDANGICSNCAQLWSATAPIRSFDTGATRDTEEGKLDFEGFINPLVLYKYAEYMNKNRLMKDGTVRDSDNWQKGFGEKHLDVCMKSAFRHFMDMWMEHRGLESRDGLDEAICGLLFNVMAYYKKILYDRREDESVRKDD